MFGKFPDLSLSIVNFLVPKGPQKRMSPPEGHLLGCQSGNFCWPISGGTMTVSPT